MLKISGLVPFTTIDYPGQLSAVIFCQGCPWRCRYCHNPHLQPFSKKGCIEWDEALEFLEGRKGLLDAVVLSGGEPLLQKDLPRALQEIRQLGFKTGLHTAGGQPAQLKAALPYLDWVGMDIKAPFHLYDRITQIPKSGIAAKKSAQYLIESKIPYEFRTTVHPDLLSLVDLEVLAQEIFSMGARHYAIQSFQPNGCTDMDLINRPLRSLWDEKNLLRIQTQFETFVVRG